MGDVLDVLRRDVGAAVEEGEGAGGEGEGDGRAGRGAVLDPAGEIEPVGLRIARGDDDIDDVIADLVVDVDQVDDLARAARVIAMVARGDAPY